LSREEGIRTPEPPSTPPNPLKPFLDAAFEGFWQL
jgi:hypothetical protein